MLSASAQKKAAGKAADTSLATAKMNNALQEKIYNQNAARLSPYDTRGNAAGDAINALLGLGAGAAGVPARAPGAQGTQQYGRPVLMNEDGIGSGESAGRSGAGRLFQRFPGFVNGTGGQAPMAGGPMAAAGPATGPATPTNSLTPQAAFQNYLGSTGYQFQVDQGNQAINQGYAASGTLQSGAALKALQTYGQNTATGFFRDYLGLLGNQQSVGLSGASAIAGVGQGYANSVSQNNNSAGSAAANAYLAQGSANANTYGNVAAGIGNVANALGSSYGERGGWSGLGVGSWGPNGQALPPPGWGQR